MRVGADALPRARDADALEQLDGAVVAPRLARPVAVRADLLDDLVADRASTGFSDVIGSWKTIAISAPADPSQLVVGRRRAAPGPRSVAEPSNRAFGARVRPISVIAVTDLPEPDSPTIASTSPARSWNDTPSTACTSPSSVRKATRRSLDLEQELAVRS